MMLVMLCSGGRPTHVERSHLSPCCLVNGGRGRISRARARISERRADEQVRLGGDSALRPLFLEQLKVQRSAPSPAGQAARSHKNDSCTRPMVAGAIARALYGDLPPEKLLQALTFSLLLCFVVGVYWMMRSLKDSVFATLVGLEHQPQAKMLSLAVVTVALVLYNKVVDLVPRHQLFLIVCGTYSAVFTGTALCLGSPTIGLYGPDGKALPASPDRWLGWVHYFAVESYGSLAVSLFWQYTNSLVNLKDAKAQYGIIVAGGQIGAITGCSLVVGASRFGVAQLYGAGGMLTLAAPVIVAYHHRRFGVGSEDVAAGACTAALVAAEEDAREGGGGSGDGSGSSGSGCAGCRCEGATAARVRASPTRKTGCGPRSPVAAPAVGSKPSAAAVAPGLCEGLRLLIRHPYVLGIFAVSALFEVIATILDYQMKILGKASYHSTADFAAFMGFFGQVSRTRPRAFQKRVVPRGC